MPDYVVDKFVRGPSLLMVWVPLNGKFKSKFDPNMAQQMYQALPVREILLLDQRNIYIFIR